MDPQSAFSFFKKDVCAHEKANNKDRPKGQTWKVGQMKKVAKRQWDDLNDEDRQPYIDLYEADKERYNREKQAVKSEFFNSKLL